MLGCLYFERFKRKAKNRLQKEAHSGTFGKSVLNITRSPKKREGEGERKMRMS